MTRFCSPTTRRRWRSCATAAFHLDAEDPEADAGERVLLVRRGRTQLLAAGASGHLVELYGDAATLPMSWAAASLRLLVREAVSPAAPSA